jgi:Ran GTPase-activating protein (RanGAP) involved in mRNA processing and transport
MGSCASKKNQRPAATHQTVKKPDSQPSALPPSDLSLLKDTYTREGNHMNRKVKSCFEQVFAGESPQITEINLKFINLGEAGMTQMARVLPAYSGLKSLRLWKTKLGIEGAKRLGAVLPALPQLLILSIEDNDIRAEGVTYIAQGLPYVPLLKELYLHINKLGPEGVSVLGSAIAPKTNLEVLTIDENQITDQGLLVLLKALAGSMEVLTTLGLGFNMLSDVGAGQIRKVLDDFSELKKLTLSGNQITAKSEAQLTKAAPKLHIAF